MILLKIKSSPNHAKTWLGLLTQINSQDGGYALEGSLISSFNYWYNNLCLISHVEIV